MTKQFIIRSFIRGVPYGQRKVAGDVVAPKKWTTEVIRQTETMFKVKGSCKMKVAFVLPHNKYPVDHPYGPDLDNLLKRFQDALNQTVFAEVSGKDGCVIKLYAEKRKTKRDKESSVMLEICEL